MPLLAGDAREGSRSVDQRDDRHVGLVGQLHQAHRLAVALGARPAEVAVDVRFHVAPLLGADDHDRFALELRETADNRFVVAETAVAGELDEIREEMVDVVERVRAFRVAGELNPLPRRQLAVNLLHGLVHALGQRIDLVGKVELVVFGELLQFLQFFAQLYDRFLEFQMGFRHNC